MFSVFKVFRKKPARPTGPPARDPFLAIPHVPANVESAVDEAGLIQLRAKSPPPKDFIDRMARWCGAERDRFLQLDETGTRYWSLIDGKISLRGIEEDLRTFRDADREDNEKAVIAYTKMLMVKNWIVLEMGSRSNSNGQDSAGDNP